MLLKLLLVLAGILTSSCLAEELPPQDISPQLEVVRAKWKPPACAAAVVKNGRIIALGATGLRRSDAELRVTIDDVWHLGSCTKSITASVTGALVDAGKLRWETSIAQVFAGVPSDPAWARVTVWDLVTQQSGLGSTPRIIWQDGSKPTAQTQRASFARILLSRPPPETMGKFAYSNAGYGLLGAVLERASGKSYEELVQQCVFQPLKLTTAGFGAPATPGKIDQPWGHWRRAERLIPVDPTPENQFPAVLAPAASVHMSLRDFARYATWLSNNEPPLLTPATFKRLHTPPAGSSYAGGFWKTEMPGIGGDAMCHYGHLGGLFGAFYVGTDQVCVTVFNQEGSSWEWLGDEIASAALKAAQAAP